MYHTIHECIRFQEVIKAISEKYDRDEMHTCTKTQAETMDVKWTNSLGVKINIES